MSAQFLHNELPVRLAHRVAELEKAPYGLSAKPYVLKVRDWYVESFKELRSFPRVRDSADEEAFTSMLRKIYHRHRNVVPVMAMGVAGEFVCGKEGGGGKVASYLMAPHLCSTPRSSLYRA